ncbi:MAG: polysaccharide biosynthesis/export family protein [Acidobacteria bacterium]|nr:polysaccharide biosynthesis/export family protein [Acidobacteriota bacterium]
MNRVLKFVVLAAMALPASVAAQSGANDGALSAQMSAPTIRIEPAANRISLTEPKDQLGKTPTSRVPDADPTASYHLGTGDVLYIEFLNGTKLRGNFPITEDGTIDFPLAGGKVFVAGSDVDDVRRSIESRVRLFNNPKVKVVLRESGSHAIIVSGLVAAPGAQDLRRDAVPLYVVRATAMAHPRAAIAKVSRVVDGSLQIYSLDLDANSDFSILPGDQIEFAAGTNPGVTGYFYLAGQIVSGGRKELYEGMTLSQALAASGGVRDKAKTARISFRDASGQLVAVDIDLKTLSSGKIADPIIRQGNIIELIGR